MGQRQAWILSPWGLWGLWIVFFTVLSAILPRDASFDVAHYHIHNGWSVLNGRLNTDLAPAELHSFLNPTYNAVAYWLIKTLPGVLAAAILALPQALILPALYYLARNLTRGAGKTYPVWILLAVAATGFLAGPLMQLMSSVRNDAIGALGFLMGLLLILPENPADLNWRRLAGASLLVGFLTGMKLTNATYAMGFAGAVMVVLPGVRARLQGAAICTAAGLAGIVAGGGAWAYTLWQKFGNPVFPLMNGIFQSPEGTEHSFRDARFLPDGVFEGVIRPFQFLFDGSLITEEAFFDARFQLGYVAAFMIIGVALARFRKADFPGLRQALALASGVLVMIFFWTFMFSIQRYVLVAWLVGPLLGLVAYQQLSTKFTIPAKWEQYGILAVCLGLIATTQDTPIRRVPWTAPMEPYVSATLPDTFEFEDSIVIFAGPLPTSFLATAFPESATFTHAIAQTWSAPALVNYQPRIEHMLWNTGASRDLYAVIYDGPEDTSSADFVSNEMQAQLGLRLVLEACEPIETSFQLRSNEWQVCPVKRNRTD